MMQVLSIIVLLISGLCCSKGQVQDYDIDKPSPTGSYRVKVRVIPSRPDKPREEARFQFFKGDKLVDSWDWQQQDWLEPSFATLTPIEWIANNVLRIGGGGKSPYNFSDEIKIVNNTSHNLEIVSFGYHGETFKIFDLARGSTTVIHPKPWFTTKGEAFGFGYSGIAANGKRFQGTIEAGERTSASSGSATFQIVVKTGDLY